MSDASPETCPLCPRSGPPSHPRSSTTAAGPSGVTNGESSTAIAPEDDQPQDVSKSLPSAEGEEKVDDDEDDDTVLSWIYCPKCKGWYHGVCILSTSDETRATVPEPVREYIEKDEEGIWTDWTAWVNKWYVG